MVKVKVIDFFLDKEENLSPRKPGEKLTVTKERAEYLKLLGYVKILEDKPCNPKIDTVKQNK